MDERRLLRHAVIVVESLDVLPWVTGNRLDSRAELENFAQLRRLVETGYDPAARFDNLTLYARRE